MTAESSLAKLYASTVGVEPASIEELPSSGSNRRYFRLQAPGQDSLIGVLGTCREENEAFIYLDEHFEKRGIAVPKIAAVSDDHLTYLQQDLGDTLLFNAIEKGRVSRAFSA